MLILKLKRSSMFFPRNFIVLTFISKSRMYFKLIFMYGMRVKVYFFNRDILLLQYPLLKRFSFPHWISLTSLSKNDWLYRYGSISDLFCSIDLHVYAYAITTPFDHTKMYYSISCTSTSWNQVGQLPGCSLANLSLHSTNAWVDIQQRLK